MVAEAHPKEVSPHTVLRDLDSKFIYNLSYFHLWFLPNSFALENYFNHMPHLILNPFQTKGILKVAAIACLSLAAKRCVQPYSAFHHLQLGGIYFYYTHDTVPSDQFKPNPKLFFLSIRSELHCVSLNQIFHKDNCYKYQNSWQRHLKESQSVYVILVINIDDNFWTFVVHQHWVTLPVVQHYTVEQ